MALQVESCLVVGVADAIFHPLQTFQIVGDFLTKLRPIASVINSVFQEIYCFKIGFIRVIIGNNHRSDAKVNLLSIIISYGIGVSELLIKLHGLSGRGID